MVFLQKYSTPKYFNNFLDSKVDFVDDFFNSYNSLPKTIYPATDIIHNDNEILLKIELCGMEKENIKIDLKDDLLIVSGEKTNSYDISKAISKGISYGKFEKSFKLADVISIPDISAKYLNGILEITLPIKEEKLPKETTISIQ